MQTGDVVLFSNISEPVVWIEKDVLQDLAPWLEDTEECYETWYQGEDEKYISYMRPYRKSKWAVIIIKIYLIKEEFPILKAVGPGQITHRRLRDLPGR